MEISFDKVLTNGVMGFKIDLIVWKYVLSIKPCKLYLGLK